MRLALPLPLLLCAVAHAQRPNFLVIVADDCTVWDLGCYGGQAATPNLDRLCAEGVRFTACTQAAPMCSPTRHCLYTGLYPVRSGAWPNHTHAYEGTRSVAHHLGEAGYRVALSGKSHVGPESVFPFETSRRRVKDLGSVEPSIRAMKRLLAECAEDGTSFCLFACSNEPHAPWNRGDPAAYPPGELDLPPNFVDTPATREAYSRYLAAVTFFDAQVGRYLALLEEQGLADSTLVMVLSEQGSNFPFAKWTCYEAGLASGMIVRWPGQAPAGRVSGALVEYVDVLPTLLAAAGVEAPAGLDGASFLPVVRGERDAHDTHAFGLQTSRGINHGPEFYGIRSVRSARYRYVLNLTPGVEFTNVVYTAEWFHEWQAAAKEGDEHAAAMVARYSRRPAEELYDLTADPWCMHDLAGDEDLVEVQRDLRHALDAWMRQQGDTGQLVELAAKERQKRREK